MTLPHDISQSRLAAAGDRRIAWADRSMDVLATIRKRFLRSKPLRGVRISACLHVTAETANLMRTLRAGGAQVSLCASNPLSTQDDVAASLVHTHKIPVYARKGENRKVYFKHLHSVLATKPHITMDDGADLANALHGDPKYTRMPVWASTEETTTGVIRLRSMEKSGVLRMPVIAVNDAKTKHFFDNRYGTGQSTMDGIIRATNMLIAGKTVVVAGYGWCGRGVASRARGLGAQVIITEIDPLKSIEAVFDGYRVMPMAQAANQGDIFVTLTGNINVIRKEHFLKMKDGAIVCNSGHFDVEIDLKTLSKMSIRETALRDFTVEHVIRGGKRIIVLAEGRLINLAAAEGHPPSVMDMSFANQALSAEYLVKHHTELSPRVYSVPEPIDREIARVKLATMGVRIDRLTSEQIRYLGSWEEGT